MRQDAGTRAVEDEEEVTGGWVEDEEEAKACWVVAIFLNLGSGRGGAGSVLDDLGGWRATVGTAEAEDWAGGGAEGGLGGLGALRAVGEGSGAIVGQISDANHTVCIQGAFSQRIHDCAF